MEMSKMDRIFWFQNDSCSYLRILACICHSQNAHDIIYLIFKTFHNFGRNLGQFHISKLCNNELKRMQNSKDVPFSFLICTIIQIKCKL